MKPTRLERAIRILKKCAVGRPFVLVVETAHADAPKTRVRFYNGDNMAGWQVKGLLCEAMDSTRAACDEPPEEDDPLGL